MTDYYEVTEHFRFLSIPMVRKAYSSTHANHVALFMYGKDLNNFKTYKNGRLVILHPNMPKKILLVSDMNDFQKYIEDWVSPINNKLEGDIG